MKRPWWLPEGTGPTSVLYAMDGDMMFCGGALPHTFTTPKIVVMFDRILTGDEMLIVRDALLADDIATISTIPDMSLLEVL